ncbi:MAG: hypothetical protein AAGA80_21185, partial [Cyanobacteria bacterium P01_F01_bin.143]
MEIVLVEPDKKVIEEYKKERKKLDQFFRKGRRLNINKFRKTNPIYNTLHRKYDFRFSDRGFEDEIRKIISKLRIISLKDLKKIYPETVNPRSGQLYSLHPTNDKEIVPLGSYGSLTKDRHYELISLMIKLFAKKIKIKKTEKFSRVTNFGASIISVEGVGVEAKYKKISSIENDDQIEVYCNDPTNFFARRNIIQRMNNRYAIDKDILNRSKWFKNNSEINNIFEGRTGNNTISKWNRTFEIKGFNQSE